MTKESKNTNPEEEVLAAIALMPEADRALAGKIHSIIKTSAPKLTPRLWYGMPAYTKEGKVVVFFQNASKFKTRYATLGFQHEAKLDENNIWPVAFAVTKISEAEEAKISALIKKAI